MLWACSLLILTALPARAGDSPTELLQRMKRWLEPAQASTRQLTMRVRTGSEVAEWTAAQARGTVDGRNYALTVLLTPEDLRGTALLVQEQPNGPDREWLYLPYLRRVREILPVDEFASFLNTEFTYADLGFVEIGDRTVSSAGSDVINGVAVAKVQEVPADKRTFPVIITAIAPATGQPLKREYYDVAHRLWKTETFADVAAVQGVPTAQQVRIDDVQTGYGSEYTVSKVTYGVTIPKELFDPAHLSRAADSPIWK